MDRRTPIIVALVSLLLLEACTPFPIPDTGKPTAAAEKSPTVRAVPTIFATSAATASATSAASKASTATPSATSALSPEELQHVQLFLDQSSTPLPTATPTITPTDAPCNLAEFVSDVTIPDGTTFEANEPFTKTWELKNIGSCPWTSDYNIIFSAGDQMDGPDADAIPDTVNPGDSVDLSVDLVAPSDSGNYTGNWMLQDPDGNSFGTGPDGDKPFWVKIAVTAPTTEPFAVTETDVSVDPLSFEGDCPTTFSFSADIWTTGSGTVKYYWQRSDGSKSAEASLTFQDGDFFKTVTDQWTLGSPGAEISGWDQIYIDKPNHAAFDRADFDLSCASQSQTVTLTPTQTATSTLTPTATSTQTSTQSPSQTPTSTPSPSATPTLTPGASSTATQTATTAAPTETSTTTTTGTDGPSPTPSRTPTPTKKPR